MIPREHKKMLAEIEVIMFETLWDQKSVITAYRTVSS